MQAVARRAGRKAAAAAFGLRLALDYQAPAATPVVLARQAFNVMDGELPAVRLVTLRPPSALPKPKTELKTKSNYFDIRAFYPPTVQPHSG
jgi:hypothetical protein